MSFICKLCDSPKAFGSERELKKHARSVHDASLFLATTGNKAKPVEYPIDAPSRVEKAHYNSKREILVKMDSGWIHLEDVPSEYQSYALSIVVDNEDKKEVSHTNQIADHATAVKKRKGKVLGQGPIMHVTSETLGDNIEESLIDEHPTISAKLSLEDSSSAEDDTKRDNLDNSRASSVVTPIDRKPAIINLSYSQIAKFMHCQQAWHYEYIEALMPRVQNPVLTKGTLIHLAFEKAWHAVLPYKFKTEKAEALKAARKAMKKAITEALQHYIDTTPLFEVEQDAAIETAQVALDVAKYNFKFLYKKYRPYKVDGIPLVEYEFRHKIKNNVFYNGKIDLVAVERKSKQVGIVDYKTRSAFQAPENQEFNLQNGSYMWPITNLGIPVSWSMTYEVWHEAPKEPELIKKGKALSKQVIKTDWSTYLKAIEKYDFDPDDYKEMEEKLADVKFYQEAKSYRNPLEIENTWNYVIMPAVDAAIKAYKKDKFEPIRTINPLNTNCPSCKFNIICMEELRGRYDNAADIKKEEFVYNTYLDTYKDKDDGTSH